MKVFYNYSYLIFDSGLKAMKRIIIRKEDEKIKPRREESLLL